MQVNPILYANNKNTGATIKSVNNTTYYSARQSFGYIATPEWKAAAKFLKTVNVAVCDFFSNKMMAACAEKGLDAKIDSDRLMDKFFAIALRSGFSPKQPAQKVIYL